MGPIPKVAIVASVNVPDDECHIGRICRGLENPVRRLMDNLG
jgi:hypothetical protein